MILVQDRTKEDIEDAVADGGDPEDLVMIVSNIKTATSASPSFPPMEARPYCDA